MEIVVDADVWGHSVNPNEVRHQAAHSFVVFVLESSTLRLAFDEGAAFDGANTSLFMSEFLALGLQGTLPFQALTQCFLDGRVNEYDRRVSRADKRFIEQSVRKPTDRVYVRVAVRADADALVSHDYTDFPSGVRSELEDRFEFPLQNAEEFLASDSIDDGEVNS